MNCFSGIETGHLFYPRSSVMVGYIPMFEYPKILLIIALLPEYGITNCSDPMGMVHFSAYLELAFQENQGYNKITMIIDTHVMRFLLVFFLIGMATLGLFYLSRRQLPFWGYIFYAAIILFLPAFGPFWVIAIRPGKLRSNIRQHSPGW